MRSTPVRNLTFALLGLLLGAGVAGCESEAEKSCGAFVERLEACFEARLDLSQLDAHCAAVLGHAHPPGSFEQRTATMYEGCVSATRCEAMGACFEAGGCRLILLGPDDRRPTLQCDP